MSTVQIFSTAGKIFATFMLTFLLTTNSYAKKIVFTFTGTTLKEDLKTYLKWQKYLKTNSGYEVEIKFARTYAEAVSSIKDEKTDLAYVCSSTYTILKDKNDAKLLAIPITNGSDKYYANIIALKRTNYKNLLDFKGKIFAFTDPESNSGAIAPTYYIAQKGYKNNEFFSKVIYTYDHGESIEAVLSGFVDGASIDSLVYTQYIKKHPKKAEYLRVVDKLGPFTISPIVVKSNMDEKVFKKIQDLFVSMDKTKEGKEILQHLNIDRFEKPKAQDYKKIYEMMNYLKLKK